MYNVLLTTYMYNVLLTTYMYNVLLTTYMYNVLLTTYMYNVLLTTYMYNVLYISFKWNAIYMLILDHQSLILLTTLTNNTEYNQCFQIIFFSFFMIAVIWLFKKYTVFSQVGILLQSIKKKIFIKIYNFSFFLNVKNFWKT